MGRPVVAIATLLALALPRCQAQHYVHFDIGTRNAAPIEPSTISQEVMVARAVEDQLALQTVTCATPWTKSFATQCPAGSFMTLKGHWSTVGIFACQPAGCLHANAYDQGRGGREGGGGGGGGGGGEAGGGQATSVSLSYSCAWLVSYLQCSSRVRRTRKSVATPRDVLGHYYTEWLA